MVIGSGYCASVVTSPLGLLGCALFSSRHTSGPADLAEAARAGGVRDERLLAAMAQLPRAIFVPPAHAAEAYRDEPVRISDQQVTTQPSLIAKMVEALVLRRDEKVLEIGTGYGYQTALMARLAREVWSIELWDDMSAVASWSLETVGVANATLLVGDGTIGLPEQAPFDAIIVTGAFPTVPPPLIAQLAGHGRLVQPIGPGGLEDVRLFEKDGNRLVLKRSITGAFFVPLYGEHGYSLAGAPAEP